METPPVENGGTDFRYVRDKKWPRFQYGAPIFKEISIKPACAATADVTLSYCNSIRQRAVRPVVAGNVTAPFITGQRERKGRQRLRVQSPVYVPGTMKVQEFVSVACRQEKHPTADNKEMTHTLTHAWTAHTVQETESEVMLFHIWRVSLLISKKAKQKKKRTPALREWHSKRRCYLVQEQSMTQCPVLCVWELFNTDMPADGYLNGVTPFLA